MVIDMRMKIRTSGANANRIFNLGEKYRKLSIKGKEEVGKRLQELLKMYAEFQGLLWTGKLIDTIEAKPINDEIMEVNLAFYAWAVEKGHYIKPNSRVLGILKKWALTSGHFETRGKALGWINKIKREGHIVPAREFMKPSVDELMPEIKRIYDAEFKKVK